MNRDARRLSRCGLLARRPWPAQGSTRSTENRKHWFDFRSACNSRYLGVDPAARSAAQAVSSAANYPDLARLPGLPRLSVRLRSLRASVVNPLSPLFSVLSKTQVALATRPLLSPARPSAPFGAIAIRRRTRAATNSKAQVSRTKTARRLSVPSKAADDRARRQANERTGRQQAEPRATRLGRNDRARGGIRRRAGGADPEPEERLCRS